MKKVFISHVFEDRHNINYIQKWIDDGLLTGVKLIVEQEGDIRQTGHDAVRSRLKGLISECHGVLVLAGNDTHNHDWIRAEVELANGIPIPVIVAKIGGTAGSVPPLLKQHETIKYQLKSVKNAIAKMPVRQFTK